MKRIFIPTQGPDDWKRFLAKPELHWKPGYSAMMAAERWDSRGGFHLPPEVSGVLTASGDPSLANLELLAAFPEWQTKLPGGERCSCTDVLAITRNALGLVVIAVEAKVDEPFGPTVREKMANATTGQMERIDFLVSLLFGGQAPDPAVRYQLMHRTASAILTARQFHASTAMMLVHSFSEASRWREDFEAFCSAISAQKISDDAYTVVQFERPSLFLAWCAGK
ncbi:DUF6946 family protein [Pseudoduganella sp. GCM10020061]|uniref:DUF6946 family protein n=1 Tax=Pseudoduganella sp. GCM10020061 TaxID=3317345 RepID=UPI003625E8C7